MHKQLKRVEQERKHLKTMSYKERENALARVRNGNLKQAKDLLKDYLTGEKESYALGTDIVTNLVSYGQNLFNFISYIMCQRDGGEPTKKLKKQKEEDLTKCRGLLEKIATESSTAVPISTRKGEAMYALRELGENFHYTRPQIQKLGNKFNQNNLDSAYSLASLTYVHSTEDKKEVVRVDFEPSKAA